MNNIQRAPNVDPELELWILRPFDRREGITLQQAAAIAGRTTETLRSWAANKDIGRQVGGRWLVSHPALLMFLDGDVKALHLYWQGDRTSAVVCQYFNRAGVPLPGGRSNG